MGYDPASARAGLIGSRGQEDFYMATFGFLLLWIIGLASSYLAGPVTALLFISAAKKKRLSIFHLLSLLIINAASFGIVVALLGHTCFGPGDIAICSSPFFIVISFSKLNSSRKDVYPSIGDDLRSRKYYEIGIVLIPLLQLIAMLSAWLVGASRA